MQNNDLINNESFGQYQDINHQENPQVQEQEMINQLNLLNYNDEEQVNHFLKYFRKITIIFEELNVK